MADQVNIAGFPTEHYRMVMSYDITVAFGSMPLTQTVKTTIDKWTTNAFGDVGDTFLASGALHTGNHLRHIVWSTGGDSPTEFASPSA